MRNFSKMPCIDNRQLLQEQLEHYRYQYQKHPASLVIIDDFIRPELAFQGRQFLQSQAIYKDVYGLYSRNQNANSKQAWLAANLSERFFFYQMLDSLEPHSALGTSGMIFLKLRQFLRSNDFKNYLQTIIGQTVGPPTPIKVHRMQSSHFLRRHDDRYGNRSIAFILYLSNSWKSDFGGRLNLVDKEGQEHTIEPKFDRLLIFDVANHDYHYISEITDPIHDSSACRLSINGWFLHPEQE